MADSLIGFEIEVKGLDEQLRALQYFPQTAQARLEQGMRKGMALVEREAKREAPVGVTGELRASISHDITYAMGLDVRGVVGASAPHAAAVEMGAKPHFPPVSNIAYWVDRKLRVKDGMEIYGAALAIARKIAKTGGRKQPFLMPGYEKHKDDVVRFLQDSAVQALNDVAAAAKKAVATVRKWL
jgi:hypothetical protein